MQPSRNQFNFDIAAAAGATFCTKWKSTFRDSLGKRLSLGEADPLVSRECHADVRNERHKCAKRTDLGAALSLNLDFHLVQNIASATFPFCLRENSSGTK